MGRKKINEFIKNAEYFSSLIKNTTLHLKTIGDVECSQIESIIDDHKDEFIEFAYLIQDSRKLMSMALIWKSKFEKLKAEIHDKSLKEAAKENGVFNDLKAFLSFDHFAFNAFFCDKNKIYSNMLGGYKDILNKVNTCQDEKSNEFLEALCKNIGSFEVYRANSCAELDKIGDTIIYDFLDFHGFSGGIGDINDGIDPGVVNTDL